VVPALSKERMTIKTRITKRLVDQTVASDGEHFIWDADLVGFGLRVRPSGSKSYVVKYRAGTGRESGLQHLEEYLNVKAVWIKTA